MNLLKKYLLCTLRYLHFTGAFLFFFDIFLLWLPTFIGKYFLYRKNTQDFFCVYKIQIVFTKTCCPSIWLVWCFHCLFVFLIIIRFFTTLVFKFTESETEVSGCSGQNLGEVIVWLLSLLQPQSLLGQMTLDFSVHTTPFPASHRNVRAPSVHCHTEQSHHIITHCAMNYRAGTFRTSLLMFPHWKWIVALRLSDIVVNLLFISGSTNCVKTTLKCVLEDKKRLKIYSQCRQQLELLTFKSWIVTNNIVYYYYYFLHSLHIAKEHVRCPSVCLTYVRK